MTESFRPGQVVTPEAFGNAYRAGVRKFRGIRLEHGRFDGQTFRGADLSEATLFRTTFNRCDLTETQLAKLVVQEGYFTSCDLTKADLSGTNFAGMNLTGLTMTAGAMKGASFAGAHLNGAKLSGCDLTGADFSKADLREANLAAVVARKVKFVGAELSGCVFDGAKLKEAVLDDAVADGLTSFRGAELEGAQLQRLRSRDTIGFGRAQMKSANLAGAVIKADFSGTDLESAKLRGADLRQSHIHGATLIRTDASGARLDSTSFGKNVLSRIEKDSQGKDVLVGDFNLTNASIRAARGFDVDDAREQKVKFANTTLPDGAVVPPWPAKYEWKLRKANAPEAEAPEAPAPEARAPEGAFAAGDGDEHSLHFFSDCPALGMADGSTHLNGDFSDGPIAAAMALDYFPCLKCLQQLGYPAGLVAISMYRDEHLEVYPDRLRVQKHARLLSPAETDEVMTRDITSLDPVGPSILFVPQIHVEHAGGRMKLYFEDEEIRDSILADIRFVRDGGSV